MRNKAPKIVHEHDRLLSGSQADMTRHARFGITALIVFILVAAGLLLWAPARRVLFGPPAKPQEIVVSGNRGPSERAELH